MPRRPGAGVVAGTLPGSLQRRPLRYHARVQSTRAVASWIEIASWSFALLGLLLPLAFGSPMFTPYRQAVAGWAYGASSIPSTDETLLGLMLGITGGSVAGKWIVHAMLARGPLAEGQAWARDLTLRGLAAWFLVDSAASLWIGAAFNVVMINLLPLLLVGVPLIARYNSWNNRGQTPISGAARNARLSLIGRLCLWTSVLGAATGIGIAFGGSTPLFAMWWQGLESAHYGGMPVSESAGRLALLFFGPIGGCAFAQFVMLAGFIRHDGQTRRAAWTGATSIAGWCAIDSAYGLLHNGLFNIVLINVPALLTTLPPWLMLHSRSRPR